MNDTIAAISTTLGVGAISIIRVSGNDAISIVNKIYKGNDLNKVESHTINYGHIIDNNEIIDEVLVSIMLSPKTFTKEDIIEDLRDAKELEDIEDEIKLSVYTEGLTNKFAKIDIAVGEEVIATYTQESNKNSKLEMNSDDMKMTINITNDETNKKSTIIYNIEVSEVKVGLTMNMSYAYNEKIEKPNIQNSIAIEELTEEDANKILENLMKNDGIVELMEVIGSIMPEEESIEGYENPYLEY